MTLEKAYLRHIRTSAYCCFLPDLTRFTASYCAGPKPCQAKLLKGRSVDFSLRISRSHPCSFMQYPLYCFSPPVSMSPAKDFGVVFSFYMCYILYSLKESNRQIYKSAVNRVRTACIRQDSPSSPRLHETVRLLSTLSGALEVSFLLRREERKHEAIHRR